MTFTAAALLLAWVAIALLALVCAGLMRRLDDLRERSAVDPQGLDVRALVGFGLPRSGPAAALRTLGSGIVLFSSPSCLTCRDVLDELVTEDRSTPLIVASLGGCDAVTAHAPAARCLPDAGAQFDALGIPGAPFLLALDASGSITSTLLPESPSEVRAWLAGLPRAEEAR